MLKLLPTYFFVLLCSFLLYKKRTAIEIKEDKLKTGKPYVIIIVVALVIFSGLRIRYNDTSTYRHSYEMMPTITDFSGLSLSLNGYIGHEVFSRLIKTMGISTQGYLLIYSLMTVSIYIWFIDKYSKNILFSIFLYLTIGGYLFSMAAIKQTAAIAFCLLATDRFLSGKKVQFFLWVLVGYTFHPFCILYLFVPLLMFSPWTGGTPILIALCILISFLLRPFRGFIAEIATDMGNQYSAESFAGEGVNIFRVLVTNIPLLLTFINREIYKEENNKAKCLIINLAIVNGLIMFIGLFGTANYFARLANYFAVFQAIAIPYLIADCSERNRGILTVGSIIGYFGFFYYGTGLNNAFDRYYSSITLMDYLRSIL